MNTLYGWNMSDALLTGTFGVLVALVTWLLAGFREKQSFRRDRQKEHLTKIEDLYACCIETLEMSIRATRILGNYDDIAREFSKQNALLRLLSTDEINDQDEKVSVLLEEWSTTYRRGQPKPIAGTDMGIISSGDSKFTARAKALWPGVNDEIVILIRMMRKHLEHERVAV